MDAAVTNGKIADSAITPVKLADSAVTTNKIADGAVTQAKLANDSVGNSQVADGSITNSKLADDSVTGNKIVDGTITGADLDGGINVTTTGDIEANSLTDGMLTMSGGNLASTNNTASFDVGNNASDSDVYIVNGGTGKANLNVEGNVTGGGTLGTAASRWSTVYADAVNFLTGLTNADNTSGTASNIDLGTDSADASQIHIGNATASVNIEDANWSIDSIGDANFSQATVNDLAVNNNVITDLNVTGAGSYTGTLTVGGKTTISSGGLDVTGGSDFRDNVDLHNNVVTNIGNAGTEFTGTGGLTLAGLLTANGGASFSGTTNFNGNVDLNSNTISNIGNAGTDFTGSGGLTLAGLFTANGGADFNCHDIDGVDTVNANSVNTQDVTATGTADLTSAKTRINSGATLPASCSTGEIFVRTSGAPRQLQLDQELTIS